MSVLESEIEAAVKKWADEHGILNAKFTPMNAGGYPDRMFFLNGGAPLLIEFKRPGEEPTKLQAYTIRKLRENGYDVRWTDSKEAAIAWLQERLSAGAPTPRLPAARGGVERRPRRQR